MSYLHDGSPEMHSLRPHRTVEESGECALAFRGAGCCCALISSLGEAHLVLEVLAEGLAEAEAEAGGHVGRCSLLLSGRWDVSVSKV